MRKSGVTEAYSPIKLSHCNKIQEGAAPHCGEENTVGKRILDLFRRDVVLTVSLVLAVLSCLIAPPGPAYVGYIDFNTLIVLFCLMLLVEGLREENFLQYIAAKVLSRVGTMRGMAATLIFLCFFSSMFITNDVSLITFVPLGVMMLRMASLRRKLCYTVTLMTIAANLGSMFTPIGNPQNLYLFALSGLSLPEFLLLTGPYAAGAALLLGVCVLFGYRHRQLSIRMGETAPLRRGNIAFYLVLFLLCVLTVAGFLPHPALLAVVGILLLWRNRGLFVRIDYSLILTFVFFFIFVGNLKQLDALQTWIGGVMAGREQRARRHAPVRVQQRPAGADRGGERGGPGDPDRLHGQPDLLQAGGGTVPQSEKAVFDPVHPPEPGLFGAAVLDLRTCNP